MPTEVEKDTVTGTETTGHDWDGIKELNTPLPKWWIYVFYATIVWSLGYYVVYPAVPGISGYTKGVLGWSQRAELDDRLAAARAGQARWLDRIDAAPIAQVRDEDELRDFALAGGRAAFADNCAPCHGLGGAGQTGYPTLADDDWLWNGTLDAIYKTIKFGVRSSHAETRASEMPAFGAEDILTAEQVADTTEYVLSLAGAADVDREAAERGAVVYVENCADCHGENGDGNSDLGAPRLNDAISLYGHEREAVAAQINRPKHGVMPAWIGRVDDTTVKMLSVYVHALGGGR